MPDGVCAFSLRPIQGPHHAAGHGKAATLRHTRRCHSKTPVQECQHAMNKFEEIKATKDGLDVWPDILRYAREGWEAISDDDKARMKWYGLFFRKHTPGYFMLRIRIPNGIASAAQLRAIAGIASDFGRSELDITTRQQIQVRWFRIEHVPEIFSRLNAVGLDSRQTGMDNIRNVMGCPLAGITPHELFDASPAVRAFTAAFVGNPEFTNLPRKFNVAITGCPSNCVALESQDIALVPAEKLGGDGLPVYGCNVLVGGKMGSGGFTPAQPVNAFAHLDEAAEVCCRIVEIFRDYGPRESRSQARLSFLLEDWGMERFRSAGRCPRLAPTRAGCARAITLASSRRRSSASTALGWRCRW